ncbi:hypothetical protein HRG_008242 [Hirsutella rhossiliensis]|uniref:Fungal-type protein kinase domain-containing protein n=1 Tax=Hirsutella rhossiliensis TaxID=111463 RepID=A0A9P8MTX0_9HYPO|nr:uncharacterized protein HRG_08242 [Hirsutella rhossiliensis]KAH0961089.1 hypothetical protein HRG_08242 [Hirsutella rhossiliensis]
MELWVFDRGQATIPREPTIFSRVCKDIVSDGLTCYRARLSTSEHWDHAVKVKWLPASSPSELEMVELAKQRNVWGVLRLLDHQRPRSTNGLHHGLLFGARRNGLHRAAARLDPSLSIWQPNQQHGSQLHGRDTARRIPLQI